MLKMLWLVLCHCRIGRTLRPSVPIRLSSNINQVVPPRHCSNMGGKAMQITRKITPGQKGAKRLHDRHPGRDVGGSSRSFPMDLDLD